MRLQWRGECVLWRRSSRTVEQSLMVEAPLCCMAEFGRSAHGRDSRRVRLCPAAVAGTLACGVRQ
jgi:hypothetical protein